MSSGARARVERLVAAARRIADPNDDLGRRARVALAVTTGLSPRGIELGFEHLETSPSAAEIDALSSSVPRVPHAHVLLSANVFIAAHRAIALALAASERVSVRASRRDPVLAQLLHESVGGFELVPELHFEAGSHVWAYGTDETLRRVASRVPDGVVLHAHGAGIGVAVIEADALDPSARSLAARALARDVAVFDQRGCLSPRLALFVGAAADAVAFAQMLAQALAEFELEVPLGELDPEERAEVARFRDTATYAGPVFGAGRGFVSVDPSPASWIAPVGRSLRIAHPGNPFALLAALAPAITSVGTACGEALVARVRSLVPAARVSELGQMQRPPFDGPVDHRPA